MTGFELQTSGVPTERQPRLFTLFIPPIPIFKLLFAAKKCTQTIATILRKL